MLSLVSSSVNHEMLTPIKCVLQVIKKVKDSCKDKQTESDLSTVENTSKLLLNQVRSNLDGGLLQQEKFTPHLEESPLFSLIG